jgi:2-amino-4-hydroxy-6-hydroxymethyldihydropteridine diphosphokinase
MIDVYLGLGSNLAEPSMQISLALSALAKLKDTSVVSCSSLYSSLPMGPKEQANYVNAVVYLHTNLGPLDLLAATQAIELAQGRERKNERWGPRTLDIDILLYGNEMINNEELVVPHYGMKVREFVLYPLLEIEPQLCLPNGEMLADIVKDCPNNGLSILSPAPTF